MDYFPSPRVFAFSVLLCPDFVFFRTRFMRSFFLSVKFRVFRGHKCRVHATLSKPRNTRNFTDNTAPHSGESGCGQSLLQVSVSSCENSTGVLLFWARRRRNTSRPLKPGNAMPSTTASYSVFQRKASASSPRRQVSVLWHSARGFSASHRLSCGSSSTTSTRWSQPFCIGSVKRHTCSVTGASSGTGGGGADGGGGV